MSGTPDDLAEFTTLSSKVAAGSADDAEKARWRELRSRLTDRSATDPGPPPQERRDVRVTAKLRLGYAPVSEMAVSFADNIGEGGLQFTMQRHVAVGELVLLHVVLGATPLILLSRVVWSTREGGHFKVGVEFLATGLHEREQIDAYVALARQADLPMAAGAGTVLPSSDLKEDDKTPTS